MNVQRTLRLTRMTMGAVLAPGAASLTVSSAQGVEATDTTSPRLSTPPFARFTVGQQVVDSD